MNPTPLALQTPPELQAYGWTTADLWCAPLVTGIYALLTHAQPFWAESHTLLTELLGMSVQGKPVEPVDPETARAFCALVLACLFSGRTVKNFTNYFDRPVGVVRKELQKGNGCLSRCLIVVSLNSFFHRTKNEDAMIMAVESDFEQTRDFIVEPSLSTVCYSDDVAVLEYM